MIVAYPADAAHYVIKRDGGKCRTCGSRNRIQVHHIIPVKDGGGLCGPENLITLCGICHGIAHRKPRIGDKQVVA